MTMFVKSKDNTDEMWNGARSGREGAVDVFGADEVRQRDSACACTFLLIHPFAGRPPTSLCWHLG